MKSYAVATVERDADRVIARAARLIESGVDLIQLRTTSLADRDFLEAARAIAAIPRPRTKFLVSRRPDIAMLVGADGVHLPSAGIPADAVRSLSQGLMIGRSCHTVEDCRTAMEERADYVFLSPVFDTRSKVSAAAVTLDDLRAAAALGVDVFALGGISRENLRTFAGVPIAGVAAVTLFMNDEPIERILEEVRAL